MNKSTRKLDHARSLLMKFSESYKSFISSNFQIMKRKNTEGKIVAYLKINKSIPNEWDLDITDIIHNTRAALDLLVSDLLENNSQPIGSKSAFPINRSEADFLREGLKRLKGIKNEHIEIIKKFRPYYGGNSLLWELHQADNIGKHRKIVPVMGQNSAVILDMGAHLTKIFGKDIVGDIPPMPVGIAPSEKHAYNGMDLFISDDTFWDDKSQFPKFQFDLAFEKDDMISGQNVGNKLNQYIDLVGSILEEFD